MNRLIITMVIFAAVPALPAPREEAARQKKTAPLSNRDLNLQADRKLLKIDVRANKTIIMEEMLQLDPAAAQVFSPIYQQYNAELAKLENQALPMLREYALNYGTVSDPRASEIGKALINYEMGRAALLWKYFAQVNGKLGAKTALRFYEIEDQMLALIDLQDAAILPAFEPSPVS